MSEIFLYASRAVMPLLLMILLSLGLDRAAIRRVFVDDPF